MPTNKPKRKHKEEAGSNPTGKRNAKAKPGIKVTAANTVDFGLSTASTMEKREEPKAPTVETPDDLKTQTVEKPVELKMQTSPKKPTVPGVRHMRTRPYLAGTIIAKHGLAAGVTDEMVAELDQAYEKPNPIESRICLKNAHHAARGYLGIAEDAVK